MINNPVGAKRRFVFYLLFALFFTPFVLAETTSNLVYDSAANNITLTYDSLNRVLYKNSSSENVAYGYDKDLYGIVSNITSNNIEIRYEYDDKFRVIKETRIIDGIQFTKEYLYDSADKVISTVVSGTDIDYIFNKQGKVRNIPGFISDSNYNPFGSILNRTYNNNLVQTFTYNTSNNRLVTITIPSVQNLAYTYDPVGNILTINDVINNRKHNMTYDSLDRLTKAIVGPDRFVYSYNSIGNIMKVVKNNESKKFVYNGSQAHAPSKIIEGSAGVDVYHINESSNHTKNRTIEFYLVNDWNASISANWTVYFGDGNVSSAVGITLTAEGYTKITASHNYSRGGSYPVIVTAQSPNSTDTEIKNLQFGLRANALRSIINNGSQRIFEFEIHNDINENISDASWNCTENVVSSSRFNLSGRETRIESISINFTTPGEKNVTCIVTSNDGTERKSLDIDVTGVEVEGYDVLRENISTKVISFTAENKYSTANTNISVITDNTAFSRNAVIKKDSSVMVFTEVNYSSDGNKNYAITLDGGNSIRKDYLVPTKLEGATIENYSRLDNGTQQHYIFYVRNNWNSSNVIVTMTNPSSTNTSFIAQNQTLKYVVTTNYTTQGQKNPRITAQVSSFTDRVADNFDIKPLKIDTMNTLSESQNNSVTELVVRNNLNSTQYFMWWLNTGFENLTSSRTLNLTTNNIFVYIASNYSSAGVYRTSITINSSSYNDTERGVIVT